VPFMVPLVHDLNSLNSPPDPVETEIQLSEVP
jgi:hypothetical protein